MAGRRPNKKEKPDGLSGMLGHNGIYKFLGLTQLLGECLDFFLIFFTGFQAIELE